MEQIFLFVLNNAITVSALIIAIIMVRALGKKMPKWITCMLWMIVAVKLIVPVQFESTLSMIPERKPILSEIVMRKEYASDLTTDNSQENSFKTSGVGVSTGTGLIEDDALMKEAKRLMFLLHIGQVFWFAGMTVMMTYAVATYMLIRKRVSASVMIDSKVYECDDISDSFVLGTISPKVYIPSALSERAREYILKHEFAHLSRYDHLWKPLGFLILSVYWFNPLCWIAYILLCRDIEYACDEKVTRDIGAIEKAEYCKVLLEHSMPRKMIAACPVAFGETDVRNRIKNVVNYKKPAFWISVASIIVCIAVGVCFATNRGSEKVEQASGKTQTELEEELKQKASELAELQNKVSELQKQSAELQRIKSEQDEWEEISYGRNISVMGRKQPSGAEYIGSETGASDASYTDEDVMKLQDEVNRSLEEIHNISDDYREKEEDLYKKWRSLHAILEQQQEEFQRNTTPEIKDLIVRSYKAIADGNEKEIIDICKGNVDAEGIKTLSKYIDNYYLMKVYTIPGPVSGSYVAYAYGKIKLREHGDVLVPQIDTFYICTNESGSVYINCNSKDGAVSGHIKSLSEQPAIADIMYQCPNEESLRMNTKYKDVADIVVDFRNEVNKLLQN